MRDLVRVCGLTFSLAVALAGCAGSDQDVLGSSEALRGGCHTVCPHCPPNQICPMIACYLECHGAPQREQCGDTLCPSGQVCCNASCGVCTDPGGLCTQEVCDPAPAAGCTTDADCRTFSNYCDGCACAALSSGESDPTCSGTTVACFADPCMNMDAVCDTATGACTLVSAL